MKGIYTIRHLTTGRCYVGSSVNCQRRWAQHKSAIRKGKHPAKHLMHGFQKHGSDAFTFEILEECDASMLLERENYWIAKLNPVFNVAPVAGSNRGFKHTAATIKNMRASRTPEVRAAISAAQKGRIKSAEEIARLSASLMGRISPRTGVVLSDEIKEKISKSKCGSSRSPAATAKARLKQIGQKRTAEQRARMSAAQKGRTFSEETKLKMSIAARAYRAKMQQTMQNSL